jgi:hypothetical protein
MDSKKGLFTRLKLIFELGRRLLPSMVTTVPGGPELGMRVSIFGMPRQEPGGMVNLAPLLDLACPVPMSMLLTKIVYKPQAALDGTVNLI